MDIFADIVQAVNGGQIVVNEGNNRFRTAVHPVGRLLHILTVAQIGQDDLELAVEDIP